MAFSSKNFTKFHGYTVDADAYLLAWKYRTLNDALATVLADGYFNSYIDEMHVGDLLYIQATDGFGWYRVTSVTTNVALDSFGLSGSGAITVSSAEMLALAASPKTLIAAPGSGKVARFKGIDLFLDFNSAAYTITAGGDDLSVRYEDGTGAIVSQTLDTAGFLDATADSHLAGEPVDEVGGDLADHANKALVLDNIGANEYTNGDSPVYAKVKYEIVSVPF